jgi:uncharacterized RDD family membrane protein YckC
VPEEAVYFAREDYVGFLGRLAIDSIDLAVLLVAYIIAGMFIPEEYLSAILILWFIVVYLYLAILKATGIPTIGYWIVKARIVDPKGNPPSLFKATIRFCFAFIGPINFILDLIWISGDRYRQALRDKFGHTYVVKNTAKPVGIGEILYRRYFIFGYSFIFAEIKETAKIGADDNSDKTQVNN